MEFGDSVAPASKWAPKPIRPLAIRVAGPAAYPISFQTAPIIAPFPPDRWRVEGRLGGGGPPLNRWFKRLEAAVGPGPLPPPPPHFAATQTRAYFLGWQNRQPIAAGPHVTHPKYLRYILAVSVTGSGSTDSNISGCS